MKDLNYFPLDVESNIYGMTKLEFEDATSKILAATLDCRLYCITYNKFKPQTREVEFTYIPTGAKIISIGALKRAPHDFVIGITHSLSPSVPSKAGGSSGVSSSSPASPNPIGDMSGHANRQTTTYYFNIYASESAHASSGFDLDHVAQGCQTLRLRYVPYHLYSSELLSYQRRGQQKRTTGGKCERRPVWLLSGGDECIHAFTEDQPYQSFAECPMDECFPELCDKQQSIALWMDVVNIEHANNLDQNEPDHQGVVAERAVALGFEDGSVRLYQSALTARNTDGFQLIRVSIFDAYTTIIPCVRLFTVNSMDLQGSRLRRLLRDRCNLICDTQSKQADEHQQHSRNQLNLLVVSSTNESLVFRNVLNEGLADKYELPSSKRLDCVTTATIGDTSANGHNDLLLGTHGKELLTYQYDAASERYQLISVDILNYPVFSLDMLDLTGDGLKDVAILLASGTLIMQAVVKDVMELCKRRLDAILSSLDLK